MEKNYSFSEAKDIRRDEFTENYEDVILSGIVADAGKELLFIESKVIKTKESQETLLVIEPMIRKGSKVLPMNGLFSRNTLTPADVDRLQNFTAVDCILRYGVFVDENGEEKVGMPKVIALIDANRKIFKPSGEKRVYSEA